MKFRTLWISLGVWKIYTWKVVDGTSLACIFFGLLVGIPCAISYYKDEGQPARIAILQGTQLYLVET